MTARGADRTLVRQGFFARIVPVHIDIHSLCLNQCLYVGLQACVESRLLIVQ